MKIMFKLAIVNIRRKKMRYFLLMVTFILSSLVLVTSIFFKDAAVKTRENELRDNSLNSQLLITAKSDSKNIYFSPDLVIKNLKELNGIEYICTKCGGSAYYNTSKDQINIVGIDFNVENQIYPFHFVKSYNASTNEKKIIISKSYAEKHNLDIKDKMIISNANREMEFTVSGITKDDGVFKNNNLAFISLCDAQKIFDQNEKVYSIGITIDNLDEINKITDNVKSILPSYLVVNQQYDLDFFKSYVESINTALTIFAVFSILVAIYLTYSTFKTILFERLAEIGTLKSIGVSKKQICITSYIENLLIVSSSTIIGSIISIPILNRIIFLIVGSKVIIEIEYLKVMFVIFLLIASGLSSITYTIYQINKISVISIIKGEVISIKENKKYLKYLTGILCLIASICILIIGDKFKYGLKIYIFGLCLFIMSFFMLIKIVHIFINTYIFKPICNLNSKIYVLIKEFTRNYGKSAQSLIIISIVIAITYFSLNLSQIIKNSIGKVYDGYDITISEYGAESDDLVQKLMQVKGINSVISEIRTDMNIKNISIQLSGINYQEYSPSAFGVIKSGEKKHMIDMLNHDRNVIITTTFAKNTNTKLNDTLIINNHSYKVIGIVSSFENMGKELFISKNNYLNDIVFNKTCFYIIKSKKNYKIQDIIKDIDSSINHQSYNYTVNSLEEIKNMNNQENNKIFLIINILIGISVVVIILCLNNNLIINVLSRTKELSIKRTVGMSLMQIFINITLEGAFLGIEGGMLGLILGFTSNLFLIKILSFYIGDLNVCFNTSILFLLMLISGAIGFLSSLFPFKCFSKINIMQSIKDIT